MAEERKKEDVRIRKTYKSLMEGMSELLEQRGFNRLTVHDLCERAQVSRATFYAHFEDKYDLLRYWLRSKKEEIIGKERTYTAVEKRVNGFIEENERIIGNILEGINEEAMEILREYIVYLMEIGMEEDGEQRGEYIFVSSFCASGVIGYLEWLRKNKFPRGMKLISRSSYMVIRYLKGMINEG